MLTFQSFWERPLHVLWALLFLILSLLTSLIPLVLTVEMSKINLLVAFVLLVACLATVSASDLGTSALSLGDLVRQAIQAGLPWATYIGEVTPEVEAKLAKELCLAGKCSGGVVELFSGSSCNSSLSLGYLELLPYPGIQGPCITYIKPETSALWQCAKDKNGNSFWSYSIFEVSNCEPRFLRSEARHHVGTCYGTPKGSSTYASVVWCDASSAKPLNPSNPASVDTNAPILPLEAGKCDGAAAKCDERYGVSRWFPSETDPYWDTCPPHGANNASYIFGQGLSNTCYLNSAGVNTVFTANKTASSFTISKTGGCSANATPWYAKTQFYGCNYTRPRDLTHTKLTAGSLQG